MGTRRESQKLNACLNVRNIPDGSPAAHHQVRQEASRRKDIRNGVSMNIFIAPVDHPSVIMEDTHMQTPHQIIGIDIHPITVTEISHQVIGIGQDTTTETSILPYVSRVVIQYDFNYRTKNPTTLIKSTRETRRSWRRGPTANC